MFGLTKRALCRFMEPIDPVAEISGLNDADSVQQTYADVQTSIRQVSRFSMGTNLEKTCSIVIYEECQLFLAWASSSWVP